MMKSKTVYLKLLVAALAGMSIGLLLFQYGGHTMRRKSNNDLYVLINNRNTSIVTKSPHVKHVAASAGGMVDSVTVWETGSGSFRETTLGETRKEAIRKTQKPLAKAVAPKPIPSQSSKVPPAPYVDSVVPKIVHFTWYSDPTKKNTFRFHHFISMLSAYKHIQPTKVMFWHERVPVGEWWRQIKEKVPVIEMKYRKGPTEIFGKPIKVAEHKSDIVRLEAVMNYGGIYTDLDVIVLKSFDPLLKYNTTMGYETGAGAANGLCNGIIISRPHAKFLEIWHNEYRSFKDWEWAIHSVILPAQLATKYPSLIHTEAKTLHRPNWREIKWLYNNGTIYDWSQNYAVHLWYRFHNVDHNPEDIKAINTTMGEMFRYIYYGKKDLIV
ncbi:uncharacterized protein LOC135492763 [Lineus longissimus]|uniref:uncharacterized protein LOC135492763 n=1 Tax=Lineus longissimus TaxID=88925 RepID=UPI00315D465F